MVDSKLFSTRPGKTGKSQINFSVLKSLFQRMWYTYRIPLDNSHYPDFFSAEMTKIIPKVTLGDGKCFSQPLLKRLKAKYYLSKEVFKNLY